MLAMTLVSDSYPSFGRIPSDMTMTASREDKVPTTQAQVRLGYFPAQALVSLILAANRYSVSTLSNSGCNHAFIWSCVSKR